MFLRTVHNHGKTFVADINVKDGTTDLVSGFPETPHAREEPSRTGTQNLYSLSLERYSFVFREFSYAKLYECCTPTPVVNKF